MTTNDLLFLLEEPNVVCFRDPIRALAKSRKHKIQFDASAVPYLKIINVVIISNGINIIPKFLANQVQNNTDEMYAEAKDARVFSQDSAYCGAPLASVAEVLAEEKYNGDCAEFVTVVAPINTNVCQSYISTHVLLVDAVTMTLLREPVFSFCLACHTQEFFFSYFSTYWVTLRFFYFISW